MASDRSDAILFACLLRTRNAVAASKRARRRRGSVLFSEKSFGLPPSFLLRTWASEAVHDKKSSGTWQADARQHPSQSDSKCRTGKTRAFQPRRELLVASVVANANSPEVVERFSALTGPQADRQMRFHVRSLTKPGGGSFKLARCEFEIFLRSRLHHPGLMVIACTSSAN